MEKSVRFTLAQLSPPQQVRVIAILVQMILHQLSQPVEGKPDDSANH